MIHISYSPFGVFVAALVSSNINHVHALYIIIKSMYYLCMCLYVYF